MKKTELNYIAIYAAVIATLGLIWNVIQWYKQRGKLKVRAVICRNKGSYTEEIEPKQWGDLLRVDVVNSGKENLTLSEIILRTARPKPLYFWQRLPQARMIPPVNQTPLPYTLEPTKTAYWLLDNASLLKFRTMKAFFVKDSYGREWCVSKKQIKRIRKIIQFEQNHRKAKEEAK